MPDVSDGTHERARHAGDGAWEARRLRGGVSLALNCQLASGWDPRYRQWRVAFVRRATWVFSGVRDLAREEMRKPGEGNGDL